MAKNLYPNSLSVLNTHNAAEAFWRSRWQELFRETGQIELWESPWLTASFANGTPLQDRNPIFSAICRSRQIGLRVIQNEPTPDSSQLCHWTDTFAQGDEEEFQELVISCVLAEETVQVALRVIKKWVIAGAVEDATDRNSKTG